MTRPKKRSSEPSSSNSNLLSALQFCQLVTKKEGPPCETHVLLKDHWAIAFNGVLACGQKITEDICCAPNAAIMTEALSKCGEQFSITQLNNGQLSIKSGKFKCMVPCIDPSLLGCTTPDAQLGVIDDRFKAAVEVVGVLASETAQSVIGASVLMAGASVIATDRKVMIEAWHGIDLPIGIALPKIFASALTKCNKKLQGFGFSPSSATFYFEDESWIRSQFFAEPWPDVRSILDRKANLWPVPNDFYQGLNAIAPFSEEGDVYFESGIMHSHNEDNAGASFEVFGLPKGPIFSIKQLNLIKPYMKEVDFMAPGMHVNTTMLMFMGHGIRGAIAGRG